MHTHTRTISHTVPTFPEPLLLLFYQSKSNDYGRKLKLIVIMTQIDCTSKSIMRQQKQAVSFWLWVFIGLHEPCLNNDNSKKKNKTKKNHSGLLSTATSSTCSTFSCRPWAPLTVMTHNDQTYQNMIFFIIVRLFIYFLAQSYLATVDIPFFTACLLAELLLCSVFIQEELLGISLHMSMIRSYLQWSENKLVERCMFPYAELMWF